MANKRVFIGVGHGGSDPGAVSGNLREKDMNLTIALACRKQLQLHGVSVLMSRTEDDDETLTEKISECNAYAPDIALDIHCNAGNGDGAEVFYSIDGSGKELAEDILKVFENIGQNSRGSKTLKNSKGQDGFLFIRNTNAPAVLVECAFIDNKTDVQIIDTESEQQKFGRAIATGILVNLGILKTFEDEIVENEPIDGELPWWRVQVGAFRDRNNAEALLKKLKEAGFDGYIRT